MGRQINFYLTETDWDKVRDYLVPRGFVLLDKNTATQGKPNLLDWDDIARPEPYQKFICLDGQIGALCWKPYENREDGFYLDENLSPCLSMFTGYGNGKEVWQGRFFYTPHYLKEGEWHYKNEDFLKSAQNFFAWFRRNHHKKEKSHGLYAGEAALQKNMLWA